jgi:hypothetical protein
MEFNLLILKFRGRSVAVFRDHCTRYEVCRPLNLLPLITAVSHGLIASLVQSILAVAQRSFRSLHGVPVEDIVLLSTIPGYPEQDQVELSKEIWSAVSTVVHTVTIALESGASLSVPLNDNAASAAAATDRDVSFRFAASHRNASLEHAASLIELARL